MINKLRKYVIGTLLMLAMVLVTSGAVYALDTSKAVVTKDVGGTTYLYYQATDTPVTGAKGVFELPKKSKHYYFFKNNNGIVYANTFIKTKKGIYYAQENGTLATGWTQIGNNKYYFNPKNRLVLKGGFKKVASKYYYFDKNGAMATGFKKIGKYTYYMNENTGVVAKGWADTSIGQCYFDKKGHMLTGIITVSGKKYYTKANGKRLNGLILYKGSYYYFKPSMTTGWVSTNGGRYYFRPSGKNKGKAVTGWLTLSGKQYYFGSDGKMTKGWLSIGGKKYYFDPTTGAKATGTKTIDGKTYNFGKNGYITENVTGPWKIQVNQGTQTVTVFRGTTAVRAFQCSTGLDTADTRTPNGIRYLGDKLRWHELMGPCWGQYCEHLVTSPGGGSNSPYLFHSVTYAQSGNIHSVSQAAFNNLGHKASHGCVRLAVQDAYYIYVNCPIGTQVRIFNGTKADDPMTPIRYPAISSNYDPTDPAITGRSWS